MKKTLSLLISILLMAMMLSACRSRTNTEILIDTDTLQVTHTGARITITDTVDNISYTFILKRKKPLEGDVEPIRVINTKNLIIDKYPKKLLITDLNTNENYTICISILGVKAVFNGHLWDKQGGDTE